MALDMANSDSSSAEVLRFNFFHKYIKNKFFIRFWILPKEDASIM